MIDRLLPRELWNSPSSSGTQIFSSLGQAPQTFNYAANHPNRRGGGGVVSQGLVVSSPVVDESKAHWLKLILPR